MGCTTCSFKNIRDENPELLSSNLFGSRSAFDWLKDLPELAGESDLVEVSFKDNRKEFFRNVDRLRLTYDDMVTVQIAGGYDVGIISLKGSLAERKYRLKYADTHIESLGIIFRKASGNDIQNWLEGKTKEKATLIQSRLIAQSLNLDMKISDVEFQGDNHKATFYYTAHERVDFRELVKMLSKEFGIKVEMRQIGFRQEAGKIGGIGSCGKELCCSSWRTELTTVRTSAMQVQQLSPNAEKYTGQCGKLKCCLMYELDTYLDAKADFPKELLELETKAGIAFPYKIDILKKTVWYTMSKGSSTEQPVELALGRVKEIINLNKRGKIVESLNSNEPESAEKKIIKKKTLSY